MTRTDKLAACHVKSTKKTDTRCTPRKFFRAVEKRLGIKFDIDIAASRENRLCKKYFSEQESALNRWWTGTAWCNPPYSKTLRFVKRAYNNAKDGQGSTVLLLASRTGSEWFYKYAHRAAHIIFIRGRLKFVGADNCAPFDSILMVFSPEHTGEFDFPVIQYWQPTLIERGGGKQK